MNINLKRILNVAIFLLGLLILLTLSSFWLTPGGNAATSNLEKISTAGIADEKERTIDVLFLGDSGSYSSFSPLHIWKEQGFTSYVCGSPGQRLNFTCELLEHAVKEQQPKVVFLEALVIYRQISLEKTTLSGIARAFPVFQYHDRWKKGNLGNITNRVNNSWNKDYKGYFYSNQVIAYNGTDYMNTTDEVRTIPKNNKQYIERIKKLCDENNITLVLLSTPSAKNWNYESHNGIAALAKEINCEYIDLNLENDAVKINWSKDTRDEGDHLNYTGAVKVSNYLAEYLANNYELIDHRGDKNYDNWNICLKKLDISAV